MSNSYALKIFISDVGQAGSVREAVEQKASSQEWAFGRIGPEFATSGPGSGWTKVYTVADMARRTLEEGCPYLDLEDGRLADEMDENQKVFWTTESVVRLICPEPEEALASPEEFLDMLEAVISPLGGSSDRKAWAELVATIRVAAETIEKIDIRDLVGDVTASA
jgi:hypothetical protein